MSRRSTVVKEQISVSIPIDILSKVQELAYEEGKSMSGYICQLVEQALEGRK